MRSSNLVYKIVASVVILVTASFLASTVHPLLGLVALLAIFLWIN